MMDRYRLNQILEVLLFPVCDPDLAKDREDCLFQEYDVYRKFLAIEGYGAQETAKRTESNERYKGAERRLLDYLMRRSNGNARSYDDLLMLSQYYYPPKAIRRENIKHGINAGKEEISYYCIHILARIATSLLTYRDGIAAIRTGKDYESAEDDIFDFSTIFNKVEIWNLLERITVPDIYIAIYAAERGDGITMLQGQQGSISLADKLLHQKVEKGLAENHIHFNAGYSYGILWLHEMNLAGWREEADSLQKKGDGGRQKEESCRLLQAALFRSAAALYLEECQTEETPDFPAWMCQNCEGKVKELLKLMYRGECIKQFDAGVKSGISDFYERLTGKKHVEEYDFLLESIYADYMELRTTSELIFLYKAYRQIRCLRRHTGFAYYFVQYLRIKNCFFQGLQEKYDVKGLRYFQKRYHNAGKYLRTRIGEDETMLEVFRSQNSIQALKKLEIRITPPDTAREFLGETYESCRRVMLEALYERVYRVFYAYRRCVIENIFDIRTARQLLAREQEGKITEEQRTALLKNSSVKNVNIPTMGIVFHFLKTRNLNNISGYYCWRNVWKGEHRNADYRMMTRQHMQNLSRAILEMRGSIPYISEYIVGIDAASEENAMEPWMFAPAYHVMREGKSAKIRLDGGGFQNIQDMHFTYHVGEDFRHILSGLRHIDEVMEEFRYQTGDRLGHALALGIDIDRWVEECEVAPMPVGEYLENLLWVWGKNTCEGVQLPIQLEVLENKITEIAERLYRHPDEITVRMLYQAYKKKFEAHSAQDIKMWLKDAQSEGAPTEKRTAGDHFCYYENACYSRWTVEKLCLTYYCPVFAEKYSEVCLVPVQPHEGKLFQTLQRHLIEKTERLGVFVETNPTSNLTIGDFSRMKDHPLFRLSAIEGGAGNHVQIMVNSDDPIVFNTNVENELAYIYYAAQYQGYSKEQVVTWIDTIRQNGMDGSFILKEKRMEDILREVEQIMEALRAGKGI